MSQYLSFELVNKANPEIKVDLGYWCTSIARGITSNFQIFNYTNDGDVTLDIETMKDYIGTLHEGIEDFKTNLQESINKKKESEELLIRAQTETAASIIKEDIYMYDESINDWKEDINSWESIERKLNYILDLLEDNVNEWELVYSNS